MSAAKQLLVVGASGLVGSALMRRFGRAADGTYCGNRRSGLHRLDITSAGSVKELLTALRPAVIVHAAAFANVDGCQLDAARSRAVNVEGTANVARAAAELGARYLFFSTDYVFGTRGGPHKIGEPFAPINVYGEHKIEAEALVREAVEDHLIVRACNLYGYQKGGKNFVQAVFENGRAGRRMRVPVDQRGSPTYADDLAEATAAAAGSDLRGIVHLAGPDYVDRLSLARRAARAFGLDDGFIEGVPTAELGQAAPRPLEAGLDPGDAPARLAVTLRGLDDGLVAMRAEILSGAAGTAS